eukprot:Sspe_Gene.90037::Locus_61662_Transcript_3_6_Confidence_0.250_Length_982::g.90037::m.90037
MLCCLLRLRAGGRAVGRNARRQSTYVLPSVDGFKGHFSYVKEGSGPAVVCVHGAPGSSRDFEHLAAEMSKWGTVVRVDCPGHGGTPPGDIVPSAKEIARVTSCAVVDVLGSRVKPVLLAHSLGAHVALEMVHANPTAYAALVLLAPTCARPHAKIRPLSLMQKVGEWASHPPSSLTYKAVAALLPLFYRVAGFPPHIFPPHEVLHTQRRILHIDFPRVRDVLIPSLKSIPIPVHLYYASNDRILDQGPFDDFVAALNGRNPPISVTYYDKGGHNIQKTHAVDISNDIAALTSASASRS